MARPVQLGSTCFINIDIVFSAGADAFFSFRYEQTADNGGIESIDISDWTGYMAFARRGERVLECDECLTLDENGFVHVHMTPAVTSLLPAGVYDFNIALKDQAGIVTSFVEGEATVSKMIAEVN